MKLERYKMHRGPALGHEYVEWVKASDAEALEKRVEELELQLAIGTEDGSRCNRPCEGVMVLTTPENCSCHLSPPCAACENNRPVCSFCGEEASDEPTI